MCQEEGDCRMNVRRLSGQESEEISWSYEMADTEQTQGDDLLEKVQVCSGIPCHAIWDGC